MLVENRDFFSYPWIRRRRLRGYRRNIATLFGVEKLEWCGYPKAKKSLRIRLAISIKYRRVTDKRTDGQTDRRTSCDA